MTYTTYTYEGNVNPREMTTELVLRGGDLIWYIGTTASITPTEYATLSTRYVLTLGGPTPVPPSPIGEVSVDGAKNLLGPDKAILLALPQVVTTMPIASGMAGIDAPNLIATLTAWAANGGTLRVPAGHYVTNESLGTYTPLNASSTIEMDPGTIIDFSGAPTSTVCLKITGAYGSGATNELLGVSAAPSRGTGPFTVTVANGAGFTAGQIVKLGSEDIFDPSQTNSWCGEINRVLSVAGNVVTLVDAIDGPNTYTTGNDAFLQVLTMPYRPTIRGGTFLGGGVGSQHDGLQMICCEAPRVVGTRFENCEERALVLVDCIDWYVEDQHADGSSYSGTGYGLSINNASQDGIAIGGVYRDCGHAQTCANNSSLAGVPRRNLSVGAHCYNSVRESFKAHPACFSWTLSECWSFGSTDSGFSSYGAGVRWDNCHVRNPGKYGMYFANSTAFPTTLDIVDADVQNPTQAGIACVTENSPVGAGSSQHHIHISGTVDNPANYGLEISATDTTPITFTDLKVDVQVRGNTGSQPAVYLNGISEGIFDLVGASINPGTHFVSANNVRYSQISVNAVLGGSSTGSEAAVYQTNCAHLHVRDSVAVGFRYGSFLDNATGANSACTSQGNDFAPCTTPTSGYTTTNVDRDAQLTSTITSTAPSAVQNGPRGTGGISSPFLRDYVTIGDFGMTPALSDCTTLFQAALNYVATTGQKLLATAGVFKFLGTVTYQADNLDLELEAGCTFDCTGIPYDSVWFSVYGAEATTGNPGYSLLTANAAQGATQIQVADGTQFAAGNAVKLGCNVEFDPLRTATPKGEILFVKSVSGNIVTLQWPIFDAYPVGSGPTDPAGGAFLAVETMRQTPRITGSGTIKGPGMSSPLTATLQGTLTAVSFTGTLALNSSVITAVTNFTGLANGMNVLMRGVPAYATIASFNSGAGTITLTSPAVATLTGTFAGQAGEDAVIVSTVAGWSSSGSITIGSEIINYTGITGTGPYTLAASTSYACRGAYGTTVAGHAIGATVTLASNAVGISFDRCNGPLVREVRMTGWHATAIQGIDSINGRIEWTRVTDSWLWTSGYCIALNSACQDWNVTRNVLIRGRHGATNGSVGGRFGIPRRLTFENNTIAGTVSDGDGIKTHACGEQIDMIDNVIFSTAGAGITLETALNHLSGNCIWNTATAGINLSNYTSNPTDWTCEDNKIRNAGQQNLNKEGIRVGNGNAAPSSVTAMRIRGNLIASGNGVALCVYANLATITGADISGNTLINNSGNTSLIGNKTTMLASYLVGSSIVGNVCGGLGQSTYGIEVYGSTKTAVTGNSITFLSGVTTSAGIALISSTADCPVSANTVAGGNYGVYADSSCSSCMVAYNDVSSTLTPVHLLGSGHVAYDCSGVALNMGDSATGTSTVAAAVHASNHRVGGSDPLITGASVFDSQHLTEVETMPWQLIGSSAGSGTFSSGGVYGARAVCRTAGSYQHVSIYTGATAPSGLTDARVSTHNVSDGSLRQASANLSSVIVAASTVYTVSLAVADTLTLAQECFVAAGFLGTTPPTVRGIAGVAAVMAVGSVVKTRYVTGWTGGNPITLTSQNGGVVPWLAMTP